MSKKIKSTTLYRYDVRDQNKIPDDIAAAGYKYSYLEYDKHGNQKTEIRYNKDGELEEKYVNNFDSKGRLIEELTYLTENQIAEHKTYERDKEGNVVKAFKHYQDGEKDTIKYIRDEEGKIIEKITIDSYDEEEAREVISYSNGKVKQRKVFEYDELVLDESFEYDDSGKLSEHSKWTIEDEDSKYINIFDKNGNLTKALVYSSKDKLLSKIEYTYDGKKLTGIVEETPHNNNTTSFEYDENGNPVKQKEINSEGELNNQATRKFNENDDVIETEVIINLAGRGINQHYILKHEYEYFD